MTPSSPAARILIGISLDQDDGKELLSWAIEVLAQPNDTIIALHVLVAEAEKKCRDRRKEEAKDWQSITKYQTQIRLAKAFVISLMGEFVKVCHAKQVNLEAKVGFSSGVGKGLVQEANSISANLLVIGRPRNISNRVSSAIPRYCLDHAPEGCSLVFAAKSPLPDQELQRSKSTRIEIGKFRYTSSSTRTKRENPSPRRVLDLSEEGDSPSAEEDSSSCGESNIIIAKSPPSAPKFKHQPNFKKPMSPLKRISSFFRSSFDSNGRKRSDCFFHKDKHEPLLRCFSYEEIANATNNFHPENLVGQGGYSEVYRGDLEDGRSIAVKRLAKDNSGENKEKEFLIELGIIGHVNHPNTANLEGCCIENGLYLIFKFSANGTLSSALHGKMNRSLEWAVRHKIACGIARGLHYLHKCCKHRIIHRDIKASNVLLGPDYEPQISDFGLAKWLPNKWTHHAVVPIEGTFGYLAPEYFMHGIVDEKTDVFSFGILLLEIVSGRRPVDSSRQSLLLWAKPLMESGNITELADPKLEGKYDAAQLNRLLLTASHCVRQSSIWRPSMTEVLDLIKHGNESEAARSWRIPKSPADEEVDDDYTEVFGYDLPSLLDFNDI